MATEQEATAFGNALIAAVQRQRDEALNRLAQTEANIAVLEVTAANLAAENEKLRGDKSDDNGEEE